MFVTFYTNIHLYLKKSLISRCFVIRISWRHIDPDFRRSTVRIIVRKLVCGVIEPPTTTTINYMLAYIVSTFL